MCPVSSSSGPNNGAASGRDRVVHNYVDRALEADPPASDNGSEGGGLDHNFPVKLHYMLTNMEQDGQAHIISWQPHGRCFMVHDMKEFVASMLPLWFRQSKMASFQRQLNLYGFQRITQGRDKNAYYHEYFLRGRPQLAQKITRTKVKGKGARKASSPETEPRFYELPWMKENPAPSAARAWQPGQAQTNPSSDNASGTSAPPVTASDPAVMALAASPTTGSSAAANPALLAAAAAAPTPSLGEAMGSLNYSQALSTAHFLAAGGVHPMLPNGTSQGGESLLLPSSFLQQQQRDLNSLLASLGGGPGNGPLHNTNNNSRYIPIAPASTVPDMGHYKMLEPANNNCASWNSLNSLNSTGMEATYGTVLDALKAQCAATSNNQGPFTRPGPHPF